MNIFFALDPSCLSAIRLMTNLMGGTERFFVLLKNYLIKKGHRVTTNPLLANREIYDIAIHSNRKNLEVTAKRHVCRAGSYHTDAKTEDYDLIITLSQHFADFIQRDNIKIIPVCYNPKIQNYINTDYIPRSIISSANPNRYIKHFREIKQKLSTMCVEYTWNLAGGNKLYGRSFSETFKVDKNIKQHYMGILPQEKLFKRLASSHLYCYPNFSDNSETFCVSIVEAAVLGLPVILSNRKPFIEVLPDNPYFCETVNDMVITLEMLLQKKRTELYICDTERYKESNVMPEFEQALTEIV